MNIHELKQVLMERAVPAHYYHVEEKGNDDQRVCLKQKEGKWIVCYMERGVAFDVAVLETESDACHEMLRRLLK